MNNFVEKYRDTVFTGTTFTTREYEEFQREARRDLKNQAKEHGFSIRKFNKGHFCFTAVAEREGSFFFLSVPDVRYFREGWKKHVLYRTMKNENDLTGGANMYCRWEEIGKSLDRLYSGKAGQ